MIFSSWFSGSEEHVWQPGSDFRKDHDDANGYDFDDHERNYRGVDVLHGNAWRYDTFQIEQVKSEGRSLIADFHVDHEQYAEPDRVEAKGFHDGHEHLPLLLRRQFVPQPPGQGARHAHGARHLQ